MGNGVSMGGFTCGVVRNFFFFFFFEAGEGGMTELAEVVSCLVVLLPSDGSEWFNGGGVVSIDASEGGFLDHGSPIRFTNSTAMFVEIDGSMKQARGQVHFVFIEDPIGTL